MLPARTRARPPSPAAAGPALRLAGQIRAGLEEAHGFLPFVFGTDPAADRGEQMRTAMRRYATSLARRHHDDERLPGH